MALMIPSNKSSLRTSGEKKLYQIFKDNLPSDCIVRYEVMMGYEERRPDFTIADPQRGVCIAEIKDWEVNKITNASPDSVWVKGLGGSPSPIPKINPDKKCKTYMADLREQMAAMSSLLDEKNHLSIPVAYFLIFPNINREDFLTKGLAKAIPVENIIFGDELREDGKGVLMRYEAALPLLAAPLSQQQQDDLTIALDPSIVIPKVTNSVGFIQEKAQIAVSDSQALVIHHLNLEQEGIAKSLGEGPRLLRGIAGTGKTLILLYRAKLLAANDPNIKILVLCWNIALSNYMRQAYEKFPFEAKGIVKICHFSEFVRDDLGLHYDPINNWGDERLTNELNRRQVSETEKYDVIYVDEAQDFCKEWIDFIFNKMVRGEPKERNFIFAADDAQRIYKRRDFSWDSLNFKFTGRSKVLKTIFRNSARVWIFSAFLLPEKAEYLKEGSDKLVFANQGKYEPMVLECKSLDDQIGHVVQICQDIQKEGFAARNVLILYRHKTIPWLSHYPLVENLRQRLSQAGIRSDWISQGGEAKRTFDWEANTVKISTVHSAKGMDSPVVIVLGIETFKQEKGTDIDEVKLLYVALTRAREFLVVCYTGADGLVSQLKYCEKEYDKYRPGILSL